MVELRKSFALAVAALVAAACGGGTQGHSSPEPDTAAGDPGPAMDAADAGAEDVPEPPDAGPGDTGLDAPLPEDVEPQDVESPDVPEPDAPGPDAPGPDAPGPDAPGPDAPGPDAPGPDAEDEDTWTAECGNKLCEWTEDCGACPGDCGTCPPICEDGDCDAGAGEDCATCPKDCGACPGPCGDGECSPFDGETCESCVEDCGACPPPCGDSTCEPGLGEDCVSCEADCGTCGTCGNYECEAGETCGSCPTDCWDCPPECGNGWCEYGEECDVCLEDCGPCTPKCGDNYCSWPESCDTCPVDCTEWCAEKCGDDYCDGSAGESCSSCPADCGACSTSCGDGKCKGETCDTCSKDCGACPPAVAFTKYWKTLLGGPPVAGRPLRLFYSPSRSSCVQWVQSTPIWTTFLYYRHDPADVPQSLPAVAHMGDGMGFVKTLGLYHTIQVPADATDVWLWAHSIGHLGCSNWDSKGGDNYLIPIFTEAEVQQDVGSVGGFSLKEDTLKGGLVDHGDVDPAYYFASMADEGTAAWIQIEVQVDGVTDRLYPDPLIAEEVARTAVEAVVVTDAWGAGPPGQASKPFPLDFAEANSVKGVFVYRWFPGVLTWGASPIADGAYSYRFEVRTAEGTDVTVLGAATGGDRTLVLSQKVECALFPKNPPAELCP